MGTCCQVQGNKAEYVNQTNTNDLATALGKLSNIAENEQSNRQKSFIDVDVSSNRTNPNPGPINKSFVGNYPVVVVNNDNINSLSTDVKQIIKKNSLVFNFKAAIEEVIMPIWVFVGMEILISVQGSWSCLEDETTFTSSGAKDLDIENTPYGFPLGALCGYIQGGEVFAIKDQIKYTPTISGALVMFQNNGDWDVKPTGSLFVMIEGAIKRSIEDIDLAHGWEMEIIYSLQEIRYLNDDEKKLIYYINKVRSNPPLFADLYLFHRRNRSYLDKECFELLKSLSPLPLVTPNEQLCNVAKVHSIDVANNNLSGHLSSDGRTLKQRLGNLKVNHEKIGENISFGICDPLQIIVDLLVDESETKGHRKNILDPEFDWVGVAIQEHSYWGKCSVQDFAKPL